MTHQGAACDAASVHFSPTIRRTDILVNAAETYRLYLLHFLTRTKTERNDSTQQNAYPYCYSTVSLTVNGRYVLMK